MSHNPRDIIDTILDRLHSLVNTETVVGDPVELGDVTILPVIKVSIGFAAGGGEGTREDSKNEHAKEGGGGGGGGGGASISPIGFITYDGQKVRFIGVSKGKIDSLVESVPELIKKFSKGKKDGKEKAKEKDRDSHHHDKDDEEE